MPCLFNRTTIIQFSVNIFNTNPFTKLTLFINRQKGDFHIFAYPCNYLFPLHKYLFDKYLTNGSNISLNFFFNFNYNYS